MLQPHEVFQALQNMSASEPRWSGKDADSTTKTTEFGKPIFNFLHQFFVG